jgi:hypothetical protein
MDFLSEKAHNPNCQDHVTGFCFLGKPAQVESNNLRSKTPSLVGLIPGMILADVQARLTTKGFCFMALRGECSIAECSKPARIRGFCGKHYARLQRTGSTELESSNPELQKRRAISRFMALVRKTETCWLFIGCLNKQGYGEFSFRGRARGAHRVSYQLFKGEIPPGLYVMHQCDNPPCVNPDHLSVGTSGENARDAVRKGRLFIPPREHKTHCASGHEFTAETTGYYRGARFCLICRTRRNHARPTNMHLSVTVLGLNIPVCGLKHIAHGTLTNDEKKVTCKKCLRSKVMR